MSHPYLTLEFLTDDPELQRICRMYWEHDDEVNFIYSTKEIASQFELASSRLSHQLRDICHALSTEQSMSCRDCGRPYTFGSRTEFRTRWQAATKKTGRADSSWTCDECKALRRARQEEARHRRDARRREVVATTYPLERRTPVDPGELSFRQAVFLLSVIRAGATEGFDYIIAVWPDDLPLAPSDEYAYGILRELYREELLIPHPQSPITAFEFDDQDAIKSFYLGKVLWSLPIGPNNASSLDLIAELERIFRQADWPPRWVESTESLWKEIALQECLEYLTFTLNDHGLTFDVGEKTISTFTNLLRGYSVAQIYNFIWRAARDAAAFYMRQNVTKRHAANTVVGNIQRQGDRARASGWDIKPFRRDFRCPRSMLSYVYFDAVLKIGDAGFEKPPHMVEVPTEETEN